MKNYRRLSGDGSVKVVLSGDSNSPPKTTSRREPPPCNSPSTQELRTFIPVGDEVTYSADRTRLFCYVTPQQNVDYRNLAHSGLPTRHRNPSKKPDSVSRSERPYWAPDSEDLGSQSSPKFTFQHSPQSPLLTGSVVKFDQSQNVEFASFSSVQGSACSGSSHPNSSKKPVFAHNRGFSRSSRPSGNVDFPPSQSPDSSASLVSFLPVYRQKNILAIPSSGLCDLSLSSVAPAKEDVFVVNFPFPPPNSSKKARESAIVHVSTLPIFAPEPWNFPTLNLRTYPISALSLQPLSFHPGGFRIILQIADIHPCSTLLSITRRMQRMQKSGFVLGSQIGLILLPVIALSLLGFYFLRQDRLLVEKDAEERAREIALLVLRQAEAKLAETVVVPNALLTNLWPEGQRFIQLDESQRMVFPPPLKFPASAEDASSEKLQEMWRSAERAEFRSNDFGGAISILKGIEEQASEDSTKARAQFNRAILLERTGQTNEASARLNLLRDSSATLANGLPIGQVAAIRRVNLLKTSSSSDWRQEFDSLGLNLLENPGPFSLEGFRRLEQIAGTNETLLGQIDLWRKLYDQHTEARRLYTSLQPKVRSPTQPTDLTLKLDGTDWGCSIQGTNIFCRTFTDEAREVESAVAPLTASVPSFAQVAITHQGRQLFPDFAHPIVFRDARLLFSIRKENGLDVQVFLQRREILFARQKQRSLLLGGIIAAAFLMALVGTAHTWLSFQKEARLNEMKSNFVSSVSHELRAPLASMQLLSEGLQTKRVKDSEKQQEYFNFLVQECRRLAVLVENVLDFSRIEQGRKTYEFERGDLRSIIRQAIQTIAPTAIERRVEILFDASSERGEDAWEAIVDPQAMQQALVNLLDNAVKHSPPESKVEVRLAAAPQGKQISVTDHGPGISEQEHERIFERFYRLGSELRRETQGVGIGLSIVKHIVESHRGRVEVRSKPGEGATFVIFLPEV
jgi:signal transduction histidine kinase